MSITSDENLVVKIKGNVEQLEDQSGSGAPSGITFVQIQEEILQQMSAAKIAEINDFLQTNGIPLRIQNITQGSLVIIIKVLATYGQRNYFIKELSYVIAQIFHDFVISHVEDKHPSWIPHIMCSLERFSPDSDNQAKGKYY